MNILQLEASPGWGGQEIRILQEAIGLRKKGFNIIFAVMKKGGLAKKALDAGFIVYEINYKKFYWFFSFFSLINIMKKHRVDVLNTHSSSDAWLGGCIGRLLKIPIVRTRHLSTPIRKGLNSRFLYHFLTDFVVTTCAAMCPIIEKQSKKPRDRIYSIPTGVSPEEIRFVSSQVLQFRQKIRVSTTEFLVGTVCFMRSWKGIEDFLNAANILRYQSNIKWVIIGGGHEEKYRKKAKELRLDSLVTFTGHLENPFPSIAALDTFALLSTAHEGVSQASLQAAYLEKPLITTKTGGLAEVCVHGETGWNVPSFSPQKVVEAVLAFQSNPLKRKEMGKRAKQLVIKKFTREKMLKDMEKIYIKSLQNSFFD